MLLSEDLLLLLTDATTGRPPVHPEVLDTAVAGAFVVDLAIRAIAEVSDGRRGVPLGRVRIVGALWEPDDLLTRAISVIEANQHLSMHDLLAELRRRAVPPQRERLELRGLLRVTRGWNLAVMPPQRLRAVGSHEAELVQHLSRVDAGDVSSTPRTDALARLYSATRSLSPDAPPRPAEDPTRDEPWTLRLQGVPPVWVATDVVCHEIRAAHTMRDRDRGIIE